MKNFRFHRSLLFKLTVWHILFLGAAIILAGVFLYEGFEDRQINDIDRALIEIADETYEEMREEKDRDWGRAIAETEQRFARYSPFIMLVRISGNGEKKIEQTVYSPRHTEGLYLFNAEKYHKADHADIDDLIYATVSDERMGKYPVRMILFPVRGPNILQVGISLEQSRRELNQLLLVMVAAGFVLLVVASAGGWFILTRALHPVKSITGMARKISTDDLSLRIDVQNRGDELGSLIGTFNDMIARLEESVQKIRRFSGDVSHELRTPLTIIRGEIEVLLRRERSREEYVSVLNSVLEESQNMERIIDDLLFLSRVEAFGGSTLEGTVQLGEVVGAVVESRETVARRKSLDLVFSNTGSAPVRGNRDLLERLVVNLVDNAIRYTPGSGRIDVALDENDSFVSLEIADTGVGIPEKDLPRIFERFFVVDPSRSRESGGAGLGLSIVKCVADIHGARIEVFSSEGKGARFVVTFPIVRISHRFS